MFRDPIREFFEMIGPKLENLELNHIENIDEQYIVQVISFKKVNIFKKIYLGLGKVSFIKWKYARSNATLTKRISHLKK